MIDYDTWSENIIGTCMLIVSKNKLENVWLEGVDSVTSITDFNELYEQIFDDLDSEAMLSSYLEDRVISVDIFCLYEDFLSSIKIVDDEFSSKGTMVDHKKLLASQEWSCVLEASKNLINFSRQNHRD